jgi:hypothetical protein
MSPTREAAFKRLHDVLLGTGNYELSDETVLMFHAAVRIEKLEALVDRFVTPEQQEHFFNEIRRNLENG